jgi:hypothetical protein
MITSDDVQAVLTVTSDPEWLASALQRVAADPEAITEVFPVAGRRCGREARKELSGWRTDDAARVLILRTVSLRGLTLSQLVENLYRIGDAHEKRAVLLALPTLDVPIETVRDLLHDAIRTNDARLLAAALGPAAACLDASMWRQAVLKCVFTGVPLHHVADLDVRADAELATMLDGLRSERHAAGRTMPDDAMALLDRLTADA